MPIQLMRQYGTESIAIRLPFGNTCQHPNPLTYRAHPTNTNKFYPHIAMYFYLANFISSVENVDNQNCQRPNRRGSYVRCYSSGLPRTNVELGKHIGTSRQFDGSTNVYLERHGVIKESFSHIIKV